MNTKLNWSRLTPSIIGWIICILSLAFIAISIVIEEKHSTLSELLNTVGIGLLITTTVTIVLNKSFKEQIEKFLTLISTSQKIGIRMIYENREQALVAIDKEVDKTEKFIDVLAIAGTDFFHTARKVTLKKLARLMHYESNVKVRILLLHPGSKYAIDRAIVEENFDAETTNLADFNYPESKLWRNIFTSLEELQSILKYINTESTSQFSLEVRLYNVSPMLLYVNVDEKLFIEQYHLGVSEMDAESILRKCLGKKVPVIEYYKRSTNHQIFKSHFEKIWANSSKWQIKGGDYIRRLQSKLEANWVKTYTKVGSVLKIYETENILNEVEESTQTEKDVVQ